MLYYFCATDRQLKKIESGDSIRMNGSRLVLDESLRRARKRKIGSIIAVEGDKLNGSVRQGEDGTLLAKKIPNKAFLNVGPYQAIREVIAGGGIVTKWKGGKLRVLLIYRRGVWDLPKGKRTRGESNTECALREVKEELGVKKLNIKNYLGTTVHGFPQGRYYRIKTTHWYEMKTNASSFSPDLSEGIVEVRWFKWKKAIELLGYESLRNFLIDVEELID